MREGNEDSEITDEVFFYKEEKEGGKDRRTEGRKEGTNIFCVSRCCQPAAKININKEGTQGNE